MVLKAGKMASILQFDGFSSIALTCPPLVVEKILMVPPHCFTYQRNQRADTSWGSEVTFTLTNKVANCRTVLRRGERVISK